MKTNSPEDSDLIVQKLPSDIGIHRIDRKGTLKAPDKLLEDFDFDNTVLVTEVFTDEFDLENTHRRIDQSMKDLLEYDKPVLSIGGDHSVSYPVIRALKAENPDMHLVWLDAHLDLKEKVDNHVSHDVVIRELLKRGFSEDEIWFVGITEIDHDEEQFIENSDFHIYRSDEVSEFLREFKQNEQPVYLSVDIDVLKKQLAPGTGYTDGKLELTQVKEVIEKVDPENTDLVEVAPPFDKNGYTVNNARKIIEHLENKLVE